MWLARVKQDGTHSVTEVDDYEAHHYEDNRWTPIPRRPRVWRFGNWSGAGVAALGYTRQGALEMAYGHIRRAA